METPVPKRIVHVITSLEFAGAQQQMALLAREQARVGDDVRVIALDRSGALAPELQRDGVALTDLRRHGWADVVALQRFSRLCRASQPDVIHSWRAAAHSWSYAAARACNARLIVTQHRVERLDGLVPPLLDRLVRRRCAVAVVNGAADVDAQARRGWPRERVVAIPNGVPPARATKLTRSQILHELKLTGNVQLIGAVGRLHERKRLKDLIWATDLLQVIRDDVHLLLFGAGPHFERLYRFAGQAHVQHRVHFLGERNDVADWLPHLDVYWSASAWEGHSRGLLEAMAASVPVVATDLAGTREVVVPEQTGFLVPVGDRAGFARYTHRLLENRTWAAQLGAAGREHVAREFSAVQMVARYRALYD